MLVRLRSQGEWGIQWEKNFSTRDTVRFVWREFCIFHGLFERPCRLYLDGTLLHPPSTLSQVTTGAVTGSPLALTASFEATLAFYVWHTAKQEHYPGLMAALAKAWQTDMRSQYGRVRQVFRQKTSPDKANEETQAVFSCMVVANRATVLSEPLRPVLIHSPDLTPEDAIRHMLDQLLLVARQISQPQDTVSPEQRLQGDAQQQPADAAEEDVPSDPHIEILHGILILLKLALLAGCVPALLADRNTAKARGCLWLAIDGLCKQLKEHDKAQVAAAAAAARSAATQSAIVTATAHAEADVKMQTVEDLSQLLARQVLMALETAMGQSGRPAEIMCNLLSALMTRSSKRVYEAVAAEIFEQGGVEAMIDGCDGPKARAHAAFQVLCDVTDESMLHPGQVRYFHKRIQMHGMGSLPLLLCPEVKSGVPGQNDIVIEMAIEFFDPKWAQSKGCTKAELPVLCKVAKLLTDLISHISPTCTCCQDHAWPRLEEMASQALVTLQWLLGSGHLQSEPSWKLNQQEIQTAKALWTLIHGYLYRYFPTLSLNFHQLLEHILMCATPSMQQPALQSFQPCVEVISKALRRCAVDKAVYAAEPQPENERDYASQMFIIFWVFLNYTSQVLKNHPVLAVAFDTLYAYYTKPTWAIICLSGCGTQHMGMSPTQQLGMHDVICHMDQHLPAQLTAGACLAVLCEIEAAHDQDFPGFTLNSSYRQEASRLHTFGVLVRCMKRAAQMPLPWPTDLCLGFTRLLYKLQRLMCTTKAILKDSASLQQLLQQVLQQLHQSCTYGPLQKGLLCTCMMLLDRVGSTDPDHYPMKGLGRTLTDVMVKQASQPHNAAEKPPTGYSPVGLPVMGPVQLQAKMLSTTLNGLNTPEEWQHFGRHALPVCSAAFVVLADQQMRGWSDDTIEDAGSDRYQHFRPYFVMLCSYAEMQTSAQEYPQNLACAMLQALHVLVKNLESTHKARLECRSMITAGQQQAQSLMRSPLPFHQAQGMKLQADVHSMLSAHSKMSEGMAATMIPSIHAAIDSMEQMRKDPKWTVALAAAADVQSTEGWCGGQRAPPQRLRVWLKALSKTKHLSSETLSQIEDCFNSDKIVKLGASEESEVHPEEAAEEAASKAAAKAAAKKSKKQRQKARKQQDQQLQQQDDQPQGEESTQQPPKIADGVEQLSNAADSEQVQTQLQQDAQQQQEVETCTDDLQQNLQEQEQLLQRHLEHQQQQHELQSQQEQQQDLQANATSSQQLHEQQSQQQHQQQQDELYSDADSSPEAQGQRDPGLQPQHGEEQQLQPQNLQPQQQQQQQPQKLSSHGDDSQQLQEQQQDMPQQQSQAEAHVDVVLHLGNGRPKEKKPRNQKLKKQLWLQKQQDRLQLQQQQDQVQQQQQQDQLQQQQQQHQLQQQPQEIEQCLQADRKRVSLALQELQGIVSAQQAQLAASSQLTSGASKQKRHQGQKPNKHLPQQQQQHKEEQRLQPVLQEEQQHLHPLQQGHHQQDWQPQAEADAAGSTQQGNGLLKEKRQKGRKPSKQQQQQQEQQPPPDLQQQAPREQQMQAEAASPPQQGIHLPTRQQQQHKARQPSNQLRQGQEQKPLPGLQQQASGQQQHTQAEGALAPQQGLDVPKRKQRTRRPKSQLQPRQQQPQHQEAPQVQGDVDVQEQWQATGAVQQHLQPHQQSQADAVDVPGLKRNSSRHSQKQQQQQQHSHGAQQQQALQQQQPLQQLPHLQPQQQWQAESQTIEKPMRGTQILHARQPDTRRPKQQHQELQQWQDQQLLHGVNLQGHHLSNGIHQQQQQQQWQQQMLQGRDRGTSNHLMPGGRQNGRGQNPKAAAEHDQASLQSQAMSASHQPPEAIPAQPDLLSTSTSRQPQQQTVHRATADQLLKHAVAIGLPREINSDGIHRNESAAERLMSSDSHQPESNAALQPGFEQEQLAGRDMPELLCCPLTKELMIDPVIAADGFTYERHALQEWLRSRTTSPVTGNSLSSAIMVPNLAIMDILRSKK